MSETLKIGVLGADGRMGSACIRAIAESGAATLAVAFTRDDAPTLGHDAGALAGVAETGVVLQPFDADAVDACDVLIDFSLPDATHKAAEAMTQSACRAMVTGTTGQTEAELAALNAFASDIAILRAGNFSLGVNLMTALVERAAASLPEGFDIEVHEGHHRHKIDAPSGTGIMLGEAAAKGREVDFAFVSDRDGERVPGRIGLSVSRAGGLIGEHTVDFVSELERLTISHQALDRSLFADGALTAAQWLCGRAPGLYSMKSVLGLE